MQQAYHHLGLIHWDLIHTIVGHNALALYFSPTQEILQQLENVEVYRNLGFWRFGYHDSCKCLRFFFSSFSRSLAGHCFYLEIDATVVCRHYIRNVISVLGKLEQVQVLSTYLTKHNWWQLCERFVHATVGREALWPLWGCYISCHLSLSSSLRSCTCNLGA